jgi:ABC-type Mn2+/Zn2+ transport system ATPase subunit
VRDTLIGTQLVKAISGGQAKRTNIGISLITNPLVLFLDEPTSGLDSFTANEVRLGRLLLLLLLLLLILLFVTIVRLI